MSFNTRFMTQADPVRDIKGAQPSGSMEKLAVGQCIPGPARADRDPIQNAEKGKFGALDDPN